jgi:hypothetical protein
LKGCKEPRWFARQTAFLFHPVRDGLRAESGQNNGGGLAKVFVPSLWGWVVHQAPSSGKKQPPDSRGVEIAQ